MLCNVGVYCLRGPYKMVVDCSVCVGGKGAWVERYIVRTHEVVIRPAVLSGITLCDFACVS